MCLVRRKIFYLLIFLLHTFSLAALNILDEYGSLIRDVKVLKVTAGGIHISHDRGTAVLEPHHIAPAYRHYFEKEIKLFRKLRKERGVPATVPPGKKVAFATVIPVVYEGSCRIKWSITREQILKSGGRLVSAEKRIYRKNEFFYIFAQDGGLKEVHIRFSGAGREEWDRLCRHADLFPRHGSLEMLRSSVDERDKMIFYELPGKIYYTAGFLDSSSGGGELIVRVYNVNYCSFNEIISGYIK